ncbi:MAG: hypothetical protein AAFR21_04915 [Pseudomonadota bacterium]
MIEVSLGKGEFLSALQAFGPYISALIIAGSVFYASRNYKHVQRRTAYDFYDKFADRMHDIRSLQLLYPDIPKIWDGGPEGHALSNVEPRHFYFAKMLLQANEAIFLALRDPLIQTKVTKMDLNGWRQNFKTDLRAPGFADIWRNYDHVRQSYSSVFQKEVERILNEIDKENRP